MNSSVAHRELPVHWRTQPLELEVLLLLAVMHHPPAAAVEQLPLLIPRHIHGGGLGLPTFCFVQNFSRPRPRRTTAGTAATTAAVTATAATATVGEAALGYASHVCCNCSG